MHQQKHHQWPDEGGSCHLWESRLYLDHIKICSEYEKKSLVT